MKQQLCGFDRKAETFKMLIMLANSDGIFGAKPYLIDTIEEKNLSSAARHTDEKVLDQASGAIHLPQHSHKSLIYLH